MPQLRSSGHMRPATRHTWLAAIVYAALVLLMWLPFGPHTGWVNETRIVHDSQMATVWDGFTLHERMRERGGIFYQIAYLLGAAFTVPGDFTFYQVVYAALWWARGFLAFLILRRLLPDLGVFAFLAGVLVITHASDKALQASTLLNIVGMILWMLLSFYALVRAVQSTRPAPHGGWAAFACLSVYLTLWSYESELLMVLVFPALVLLATRPVRRLQWAVALAYWTVPLIYIVATALHYMSSTEGTYQQSALQAVWSTPSMLSDLGYLMRNSVAFWDWMGDVYVALDPQLPLRLAAAGAAIVCSGALAWVMVERRWQGVIVGAAVRQHALARALAAGALLFVLSFPAYLILERSRELWRTQMLSGSGAALVIVSCIGLVATSATRRRWAGVATGAVAVIAAYGVFSAVKAGAFEYQRWEAQRAVVEQVLRDLPGIRRRSVIVLVEVPPEKPTSDLRNVSRMDPFENSMWFDAALQLAFPGAGITGQYYQQGGVAAPGSPLEIRDGRWVPRQGGSFIPLAMNVTLENTIFFEYQAGGTVRLLRQVPPFITTDPGTIAAYDPDRSMIEGRIAASATATRWYLAPTDGR